MSKLFLKKLSELY